jgi:hypothetical protein
MQQAAGCCVVVGNSHPRLPQNNTRMLQSLPALLLLQNAHGRAPPAEPGMDAWLTVRTGGSAGSCGEGAATAAAGGGAGASAAGMTGGRGGAAAGYCCAGAAAAAAAAVERAAAGSVWLWYRLEPAPAAAASWATYAAGPDTVRGAAWARAWSCTVCGVGKAVIIEKSRACR